jgi:CRISPR-associated protein Cas1
MISSNMKLRIQDQQLVVTAGDEVHIPLEDINCILIENQSVTLSAYLLQKVADSGIALYVCDEKHLPNANSILMSMVATGVRCSKIM